MSGYRQHSFDPNTHEQPGQPLKPYNWVQWLGVAFGSVGILLALVDLARRFGWLDIGFDPDAGLILLLCGAGIVLINSRRAPAARVGSEQLGKNRRLLFIAVAVSAAIAAAVTVILLSQGAK